jgi:hypothetical protein
MKLASSLPPASGRGDRNGRLRRSRTVGASGLGASSKSQADWAAGGAGGHGGWNNGRCTVLWERSRETWRCWTGISYAGWAKKLENWGLSDA